MRSKKWWMKTLYSQYMQTYNAHKRHQNKEIFKLMPLRRLKKKITAKDVMQQIQDTECVEQQKITYTCQSNVYVHKIKAKNIVQA
jgi:hypothetical protein